MKCWLPNLFVSQAHIFSWQRASHSSNPTKNIQGKETAFVTVQQTTVFDPATFLGNVDLGRRIVRIKSKSTFFCAKSYYGLRLLSANGPGKPDGRIQER